MFLGSSLVYKDLQTHGALGCRGQEIPSDYVTNVMHHELSIILSTNSGTSKWHERCGGYRSVVWGGFSVSLLLYSGLQLIG